MAARIEAGLQGQRRGERGFTLIEALIAMVILIFGLVAITNLILVASDSNTVANQATAAAAEASETLERLKAIPFMTLVNNTGGDLDTPLPAEAQLGALGADEVTANTFNRIREIPGVGPIRTTWVIRQPGAGGPDTLFIVVRAESTSPMRGRRSRAELSTFRTCTSEGCP